MIHDIETPMTVKDLDMPSEFRMPSPHVYLHTYLAEMFIDPPHYRWLQILYQRVERGTSRGRRTEIKFTHSSE